MLWPEGGDDDLSIAVAVAVRVESSRSFFQPASLITRGSTTTQPRTGPFFATMASKGWLNLESAGNLVPDTHFFEGESAFNFLGLTRAQRLYGFVGWSVLSAACLASPPTDPSPSLVLGFVLSLLGSILLFLGQLGSFAGASSSSSSPVLSSTLPSPVHHRHPHRPCRDRLSHWGKPDHLATPTPCSLSAISNLVCNPNQTGNAVSLPLFLV